MNFNARRFIIVKSELLISDRTDQIKKKSPEKIFCSTEDVVPKEERDVRAWVSDPSFFLTCRSPITLYDDSSCSISAVTFSIEGRKELRRIYDLNCS
jgi:hypothetical protein